MPLPTSRPLPAGVVLGSADLGGGQGKAGEVGAAGLLCPSVALLGLQDAVRVDLALESSEERGATLRRCLICVALCV